MECTQLNERIFDLIIQKSFDELTQTEELELRTLTSEDEKVKKLVEDLLGDRDKLIDFIEYHTRSNVQTDEAELEHAKREFDCRISKMN
jgi:hypothetical protein